MKRVPESRILIQPTVQLKWIEQNQTIELLLTDKQQRTFEQIWAQYQASQAVSVVAFLNSTAGLSLELFEDDLNFALLVGADYIHQHHTTFTMRYHQPSLEWSIA